MELRAATAEELPEIVEIYNSNVPARTATTYTSPVSVESRRERLRDQEKRHPVWVADAGNPGGSRGSRLESSTSGPPTNRPD